jgi:hypothetical protein
MTNAQHIETIGRKIGEALGIPYAFRIEQGSMHISFDEIDRACEIIGEGKFLTLIKSAEYDLTDKGLIWETSR